jgi:hypothetical protein
VRVRDAQVRCDGAPPGESRPVMTARARCRLRQQLEAVAVERAEGLEGFALLADVDAARR